MTENTQKTDGVCMTVAQFDSLMRIMRVRPNSDTRKGLYMVLIEGKTLYEASHALGMANSGNLTNELTRARVVMDDVMVLHYPAIRMPARRRGRVSK